MYDFDSVSCVVCERKFDGNGDAVVCPSCGAPHHRECYREVGKCRFDALHRENFVWEPKDERRAAGDLKDGRHQERGADAGRASGSVCVSCGFANQENRLYCERCAAPLFIGKLWGGGAAGDNGDQNANGDDNGMPGGGRYPFGGGFYAAGIGNAISDGETIEDVPVGDIKRFVGNSWLYYVPMFIQLSKLGRRFSMNLSAMIFSGAWFIYRKMYGVGAALAAATIGLLTLQTYLMAAVPGLQTYLMAAVPGLLEATKRGDMSVTNELLSAHPVVSSLFFLVCAAQFGIKVFCGFSANRLYMNHCVKHTKDLTSSQSSSQSSSQLSSQSSSQLSSDEIGESLQKRGGVDLIPALVVWAISFLTSSVLPTLIV